jgi:predicted RNA-binding Zn-ribbon protein involved in translation (DUF1610 family)
MSDEDYPRLELDEEGASKCPDCGGRVNRFTNHLTEDEHTTVYECQDCDFGLETVSNLAARDRRRRMNERWVGHPNPTDEWLMSNYGGYDADGFDLDEGNGGRDTP